MGRVWDGVRPGGLAATLEVAVRVLFVVWLSAYFLFGAQPARIAYTEVLFYALAATIALYIVIGAPIRLGTPVLLVAGFVTYAMTSYFWSQRADATYTRAVTMLLLLVMFTLLWLFFGRGDPEYVLWSLCVAGILLSLYVVASYGPAAYLAGLLSGERMGGEINNVNAIALQCGAASVICFWFALHRRRRLYYLWAALPFLVTLGTGSRKGLVLLLGGIVLLYSLAMEPGRRARTLGGLAVFLLGLAVLIQLPIFETVEQRFLGMLSLLSEPGSADESALARQEMVSLGVAQFFQTPLLGIGMGASGVLTLAHFNNDTYLHNNYVELLATLGGLGFLLYYAVYAYLLLRLAPLIRARDSFAVIALILLMLQLVMDYGAVSYFSKVTYVYLLVGFTTVKHGLDDISPHWQM